jgi:hypothetical protein
MHIADGEGISSMTQADVWRSAHDIVAAGLRLAEDRCGRRLIAAYRWFDSSNILTKSIGMIGAFIGVVMGACGVVIIGVIYFVVAAAFIAALTMGIAAVCISIFLVFSYALYTIYFYYYL